MSRVSSGDRSHQYRWLLDNIEIAVDRERSLSCHALSRGPERTKNLAESTALHICSRRQPRRSLPKRNLLPVRFPQQEHFNLSAILATGIRFPNSRPSSHRSIGVLFRHEGQAAARTNISGSDASVSFSRLTAWLATDARSTLRRWRMSISVRA